MRTNRPFLVRTLTWQMGKFPVMVCFNFYFNRFSFKCFTCCLLVINMWFRSSIKACLDVVIFMFKTFCSVICLLLQFFVKLVLIRPNIDHSICFNLQDIPVKFLSEHRLTLIPNQKIGLCNYLGHRWLVKVNKKTGALSFGKGFPIFLGDNNVGHGDTLAYEVIDRASMEIQVHFYH